jgi:TPR repeat protein
MALQWFLFSSSMGNNLANYEIGFMYYHGYGVEKCYRTAEYHLNVGIQNGDLQGLSLYSNLKN